MGRESGPGVPGGGGGTPSFCIAVIIGSAIIGTRSGGPQDAIAIFEPGLQKSADLRSRALAIGLEDDPKTREGSVEALRREVEVHGARLDELDVVQPGFSGALAPVGEHLRGDVAGDDAALGAGDLGGGERRLAVPGRDVQDTAARLPRPPARRAAC